MALVELVITGAVALTVNVSVALPVPPLFVALNVTVDDPTTVGVPEMSPVPVLTDKPDGKPVALKLVGEFVAEI